MRKTLMLLMMLATMLCCNAQNKSNQDNKKIPENKKCNIVVLGDNSSAIGGDSCTNVIGWTKWFCDAFTPASCLSYARSGATWTNNALTRLNVNEKAVITTNCNVIYNQINRFKEAYKEGGQPEPTVIIISCGSCDALYAASRPEEFTVTTAKAFKTPLRDLIIKKVHEVTSLAESVRYNCELLRDAFPDAHLVIVTPSTDVKAGEEKINKVSDILVDCGSRLSIPVFRLDKNAIGAEAIGQWISSLLSSHLAQL